MSRFELTSYLIELLVFGLTDAFCGEGVYLLVIVGTRFWGCVSLRKLDLFVKFDWHVSVDCCGRVRVVIKWALIWLNCKLVRYCNIVEAFWSLLEGAEYSAYNHEKKCSRYCQSDVEGELDEVVDPVDRAVHVGGYSSSVHLRDFSFPGSNDESC